LLLAVLLLVGIVILAGRHRGGFLLSLSDYGTRNLYARQKIEVVVLSVMKVVGVVVRTGRSVFDFVDVPRYSSGHLAGKKAEAAPADRPRTFTNTQ